MFVFAAAATPSTDPFSMLMLALPMTLLFLGSEVIARLIDRRRRTEPSGTSTTTTASELDPDDETYGPSGLGEEDD